MTDYVVGDKVEDQQGLEYRVLNFSPNGKYVRVIPLSYHGTSWGYPVGKFKKIGHSLKDFFPVVEKQEAPVVNEVSKLCSMQMIFDQERWLMDFQLWLRDNVDYLFEGFDKDFPITEYIKMELKDE
jgi:hypothetical protein